MNRTPPQPDTPTDADLELLSAYIDNQLSVAERISLEQRLGAEPLLRAELAELQTTTELLRELEPLRPPRSFTLDPATAPRRMRFFSFAWVMQLGSGLAGMLLVVLASVQLLATPAPMPAMQSAPAPMAAEGGDMSAAGMPAATEAPAEMAREAAPESAADATMSMTGEEATVQPTLPPNAGGPPEIDNPAASAPVEPAPDTETIEPYATADEPTTTATPAPGLPPTLTLAIGVMLLIAAAGTYFYGRIQS